MKRILLFLLVVCSSSYLNGQIIITGILDGTLSGAEPRAIEFYAIGTVNLNDYDLQRAANDSNFDFTIDLSGLGTFTDEFFYIIGSGDNSSFISAFGSNGDFSNIIDDNGGISGNGNDSWRIVLSGTSTVVDLFDVNGANVYEDSWVIRNNTSGPSDTYSSSDWTFGGNNVLDGFSASQIGAAVPFGTFTPVTSPSVGFDSATSSETETDATFNSTIPVTLSNYGGSQVDLSVAVTGGTADMTDYTLNTTSLTFTADGTQNISIDINPDAGFDDETIEITLTETTSTG
ncbi:MAG: hypothetical protein MRY78_16630, partial [Saprospiraceae bacterium]|nr:hypothetical protein [Saprospiraceae bacterium]